MKVEFSQLQFAVTQSEYDQILNKEISFRDLPPHQIAGRITKTYENIPIPRIGESISDSYWPRQFTEQKVLDVCYIYFENLCLVTLEPFAMIADGPLHKDLKRIAGLHEWEFHRA